MTTQTMSRIGWTMSGLFAAFMIGASVAPKLLQLPVAEETLAQLGWRHGYAILIGVIELTCTVLFLVPRTAVLGAVLMIGTPRRGYRDPVARRNANVQPHSIRRLPRAVHVGRTMATQSTAALPLARSEGLNTQRWPTADRPLLTLAREKRT